MQRHRLDPLSLLAGAIFVTAGLAIGNAASPLRVVNGLVNAARWAFPVLVIVIGFALLAPVLKRKPAPEPAGEDLTDALEELPPPIDPSV